MNSRARYLQRLGIQGGSDSLPLESSPIVKQSSSQIFQAQQVAQREDETTSSTSGSFAKEGTGSLIKKLKALEEDIGKYFDGPITLDEKDEKEESTADDDDEERVNDFPGDQQLDSPRKKEKARLQLTQSFANREGDFLINYYIREEGTKIRNRYINKLISNNILKQQPSKKHQTNVYQPTRKQSYLFLETIINSVIIFDWDDTLFCTTQLHAQRFENITHEQQKHLVNLDKSASLCLREAANYGETYIITNAAQGWVEYSSRNFMPTVFKIIEELKIKVISARSLYEQKFPNQCHQWKVEAFQDLREHFDKQIITNLICLGDSHIEMEAAHLLAKEFDQSFIKTVKFKQQPRIEELIKQQDLVRDKLEQIYTNFKNLTIRLEKKSSPKDGK